MKNLLVILLFCSLCTSCFLTHQETIFTLGSLTLGDSIGSVIEKYGNPFKSDIYRQDNIHITKIYYKEPVDDTFNRYVLTTILTFKDSVLVDIEQQDFYIPSGDNVINVNPVQDSRPATINSTSKEVNTLKKE
ncbi:hypothetical protein K4L44_14910 [Halosquirtibacter laminarini]|uniref:Uncharacterized protein n=1 Tax=Halosquirtibacter laminarini TaxID=3374600 RepID=A0AC61NE79_9BACT|nr:hypothetical protein K4L44_14910 [Prolixibacteraceae bacterium]